MFINNIKTGKSKCNITVNNLSGKVQQRLTTHQAMYTNALLWLGLGMERWFGDDEAAGLSIPVSDLLGNDFVIFVGRRGLTMKHKLKGPIPSFFIQQGTTH